MQLSPSVGGPEQHQQQEQEQGGMVTVPNDGESNRSSGALCPTSPRVQK